LENKIDMYQLNLLHFFYVSEAAATTPSEDAATSGGSDAPAPVPAAPALAVNDSDPNQVNQSEKAETER
jgi:hypothetical protein